MGLEIPAEVQWLSWIVGSDWPEGDETAMRRCADAWRRAADDVKELIPDLRRGASNVLDSVQGAAADEFERYWNTFVSTDPHYLPKLAEKCEELAKQLDKGARDIEYAKYMFIALLITTATEIAALSANAIETLGTAPASIPAIEAAAQVTSRATAQKLLASIAQGAGLDVPVQAVRAAQVVKGDRAGADLEQVTMSTMSATSGMSGASGTSGTSLASAPDGATGAPGAGGAGGTAVTAGTPGGAANGSAGGTQDGVETDGDLGGDPSAPVEPVPDFVSADDSNGSADQVGAVDGHGDADSQNIRDGGSSSAPPADADGDGSSASGGSSAHPGGSSYDRVTQGFDSDPRPSAGGAGPSHDDSSAQPPVAGSGSAHSASPAPEPDDPSWAGGHSFAGGSSIDPPKPGGGMDGTRDAGPGAGSGGGMPQPGMMGFHPAGTPALHRDHAASAASAATSGAAGTSGASAAAAASAASAGSPVPYGEAPADSWPDGGAAGGSPSPGSPGTDVAGAGLFSSASGESPSGAPREQVLSQDVPGALGAADPLAVPGASDGSDVAAPQDADDRSDDRSDEHSGDHAGAAGPAVFVVPPRMGPGGRSAGRPERRPAGGRRPATAAPARPRLRPDAPDRPRANAPGGTDNTDAPGAPGKPDERRTAEAVLPDLPARLRAAYDISEATPAGRSLYGPDEQGMRDLARRVRPDPFRYVLDGHRTPAGMRVGDRELRAGDIAAIVRADPAWNRRDLVLLCWGGAVAGGAALAADLARDLGVPVVAPRGPVWSDERGLVFVAPATDRPDPAGGSGPTWPPDRGWRTFHPDSVPAPPGPDAVVTADGGGDGGGDEDGVAGADGGGDGDDSIFAGPNTDVVAGAGRTRR